MKELLISFSIGLIFLSGCANVAPYDKDNFATVKMLTNPMSEEASFESHIFSIREGSFGAESGFAGGCGCK